MTSSDIICTLLSLSICCETGQADQQSSRMSHLKNVPTSELLDRLDNAPDPHPVLRPVVSTMNDREAILTELVKRGGQPVEAHIRNLIESRSAEVNRHLRRLQVLKNDRERDLNERKAEARQIRYEMVKVMPNIALLTCLRRIQKRPDPLKISVQLSAPKCTLKNIPSIAVTIKSDDVDRIPIYFRRGGDYRSGRQARFRVFASRADGQALVPLETNAIMGGGLESVDFLKHGSEWSTRIDLSAHVKFAEPGMYSVVVAYHNRMPIAGMNENDLRGLILTKSEAVHLEIVAD